MYAPIEIPSEGDGTTYVLTGGGYFRGERLASVGYRILAALADGALALVAWGVTGVLVWAYGEVLQATGVYSTPVDALVGLVLGLLPWAVVVLNCVVLQARSGQSFGKLVFGLVLVSPRLDPTNVAVTFFARPSGLLLVARTALHALDLFLFVGVAAILVSNRRETIADRLCNTLVLRPAEPDDVPLAHLQNGARDR